MSAATSPPQQPKRSPERRLSDTFAGFGTRLGRILTNNYSSSTVDTIAEEKEANQRAAEQSQSPARSVSRGRDFTSSGRGGAGNIRSVSRSRDARPETGPDDFSQTRGRDVAPVPVHSPTGYTASGRGGAGNILRSPSRGPAGAPVVSAAEADVLAAAAEKDAEMPHSSGRGGFGNIVSKSRSRSRPPNEGTAGAMHSSGRGGAGNIVQGGSTPGEGAILEEEERKAHYHPEGPHSTGRGGTGNITSVPAPHDTAPIHHVPQVIRSSGRGGAGNIREASRAREESKTRMGKDE